MRVALDTNVLAYAEGVNGRAQRTLALHLVNRLPQEHVVLPAQTLGELFNVLIRKAGRSPSDARDALLTWRDAFTVVETSPEAVTAACDLATDHRWGIWDAVILSVASQAGCRLLLSEDMQTGFTWNGVTVVNPFAKPCYTLLEHLLANKP